MRPSSLVPAALLLALALPATAPAKSGCKANPNGTFFCTQYVRAHKSSTVALGSACHAARIYAIDASRNADVSADADFVAPHKIRMHNAPMDVYGYFLADHRIRFGNHSAFAVHVYFTKRC